MNTETITNTDTTPFERHTLRIPKVFFRDHIDRGCLIADTEDECITKVLSKHLIVNITVADLCELISDAEHYCVADQFGWEYQYLVSSARATMHAIRKQFTHAQIVEWCNLTGYRITANSLRPW